MKNGRNAAIAAAILWALTAPLAIGLHAARADELSDLRANQDLLQRRLDQLAQARGPGNPYGLGGPPGPTAVQMMGGSFPRSFLIPGTSTSIRVGGEIREWFGYWIDGGNQNSNHDTNIGNSGDLNNIPLSNSGAARRRSSDFFNQSPAQSKLNFETRTPTAWGEARSFVEFDFSNTTNTGARPFAIADNLALRLRYAYGTLGGWLAGQANSNSGDSDAGLETISFSGLTGGEGIARIPQLRYTTPLAGWGLPGALSVAAEQPETSFWSPGTGAGVVSQQTAGSPLKSASPDITMAWYIPQPWGHVDFSAALSPTLTVRDGVNIDRTFTGYFGHFSGDVKPHWFGWDKDYIVWNVNAGDGAGRYVAAGSGSTRALVSNWVAGITDANLLVKPVFEWGGNVGYRHQWTPTVRSNIGVGIWHADSNGLNGVVCSGANTAAAISARQKGTAGCNLNKENVNATVNIFWNPVAFVDVGLEYMWGHRLTVGNQRGDLNVLESRFRVRF